MLMKLKILNKTFGCLNYFFIELFTFFLFIHQSSLSIEKILSSCDIGCKYLLQPVFCLSDLFVVFFGALHI